MQHILEITCSVSRDCPQFSGFPHHVSQAGVAWGSFSSNTAFDLWEENWVLAEGNRGRERVSSAAGLEFLWKRKYMLKEEGLDACGVYARSGLTAGTKSAGKGLRPFFESRPVTRMEGEGLSSCILGRMSKPACG